MSKVTPQHYHSGDTIRAVNWNEIDDERDKEVWDRLTSNFWLPEKIPVSNDIPSWNNLTEDEQLATMRVFTGLTMLDTIQGTVGAPAIMKDAVTPHEEAVYANISFMEALTPSMEVLTTGGWVSIKDIRDGDKVAQFSPGEGMSFVPATVVPSHVSQYTYTIDAGDGIVQEVSEGHRIYLEDADGVPFTCEAHELVGLRLKYGHDLFFRSAANPTDSDAVVHDFDAACQRYFRNHQGDSPVVSEYESGVAHQSPWLLSAFDILDEYEEHAWTKTEVDILQGWGAQCGVVVSIDRVEDEDYYISFALPVKGARLIDADIIINEGQEVYCVQVPSTFLYVRHHDVGTPVVTGNCVHAKSYSNIFMTLASTDMINESFRWSEENSLIQEKAARIVSMYQGDDPHLKKIASTVLESFLFYSGFYLPLYMSTRGKLTNTADIIRLIIRDEAIHGYYIGYKYQVGVAQLDQEQQDKYRQEAFDLIVDMYDIESRYTEELYDDVGWTEDVKTFLRYNANKALNNLGYEGLFPTDSTQVKSGIMSSLSPQGDENHDFFSGSGSTYTIGEAEDTDDDDWDF